ncbi:MAG: Hsp20/alpha crystallin family protein [Vicinamibacterales bacterium]
MREAQDLMVVEPGSLMHRMFRDFDRFFEHRRGFPFVRPGKGFGEFPWSPDLELAEREHRLHVKVDLPGLKKEEISVELDDGMLTISGERTHEVEKERSAWTRSERTYGAFSRSIPVPDGVKGADVQATFTDGVLEVTVPLPEKRDTGGSKIAIGEGSAGAGAAKSAA